LALGYSSERNKERALENLEKAVRLGLRNPEIMENEPRFDFLRDTPQYQQLLRIIKNLT
jgi:hypothetical protein